VNTGALDGLLDKVKKEEDRAHKQTVKKITASVNILYKLASAKRPMITNAQAKAQGRRKVGGKYQRVSDPDAKAGVPVRSGELQRSIEKKVEDKGVKVIGSVYTDSPYANFVEFGTSRMRARPFMRPAIELGKAAIKLLFSKPDNA